MWPLICLYSSEVVGRPLAALLANDGARVFSVDIDSIQEYTKRPVSNMADSKARRYHPRHIVHPSALTLADCLGQSDVVVSAVPDPKYKIKTEALKDGCLCLNISAEKNFEKDVREKVRFSFQDNPSGLTHVRFPYIFLRLAK
jgi:methylenetetrahydrofolate dehydrogenase (NAD+)